MPFGFSQPATLRTYQPTLRDRAASAILDAIGNGPAAQNIVEGLMGSIGSGQTKAGAVDFVPVLGQVFQADQAGRQIASGHPIAGALNAALAAVPVPAAARAARGAMGFVSKPLEKAVAKAVPAAVEGAESGAPPIIAYHGSPHTFDRFDTAKIGTGEGAQAYGHGLYFAENEGVARGYRDRIADNKMIPPETLARYYTPGRIVNGYGGTDKVVGFRPGSDDNPWGWSVDVIRSDKAGNPVPGERVRNHSTQPSVAEVNGALGTGAVGSMYQVGINAHPDHFIDWDAPLSGQPAKVQEALRWSPGMMDEQAGSRLRRTFFNTSYAGDLVGKPLAWPDEVAQHLSDAGVPGIKYLDWGSRGTGQGTRNYVVFDPKNIDILKRYGIPATVLGAGGAAGLAGAKQQPEAPAT